jgi:hypothetical protein
LNFIEQLREKIAAQGLHDMVKERLRAEGYKVAEAFDLSEAVRILATRFYEKSASYRRIIEGLNALKEVTK